MRYGYARVSTRGQAHDGSSLEAQREALLTAGANEIFEEACSGAKAERPELKRLLETIKDGDTFIVTKLDRIARTAKQGLDLIDNLNKKNVIVQILNMGVIDNTSVGKLLRTMMFGFAEFERDMIVERTQEGKRIAKQNPDFREGRPPKFTEVQINHALELLKDHSFNQVSKITGISVSTLKRKNNMLKNKKTD